MKKRILSLVLATLMIISVLPAHALADNEVLTTDAAAEQDASYKVDDTVWVKDYDDLPNVGDKYEWSYTGQTKRELTCSQEQHEHGWSCYRRVGFGRYELICGKREHRHNNRCYAWLYQYKLKIKEQRQGSEKLYIAIKNYDKNKNTTRLPSEPTSNDDFSYTFFNVENGQYKAYNYNNGAPVVAFAETATEVAKYINYTTFMNLNPKPNTKEKQNVTVYGFFDANGIDLSSCAYMTQAGANIIKSHEAELISAFLGAKENDSPYTGTANDYELVVYVVKLEENGNTPGWHIDCALVPKDNVKLIYDQNYSDNQYTKNYSDLPDAQVVTKDNTEHAITVEGLKTNDKFLKTTITDKTTNEELKFVGWNTKADGTGDWYYKDGTIKLKDNDVTLYAQWSATTIKVTKTVTGLPNGVNGSQSYSFTSKYGESQTGASTTVTVAGNETETATLNLTDAELAKTHTITETKPGDLTIAGETYTCEIVYPSGQTVNPGETLKVINNWTKVEPKTHKVTFTLIEGATDHGWMNGENNAKLATREYTYEENATYNMETVVLATGYVFSGWYTKQDLSGSEVSGQQIMGDTDVNYYGKVTKSTTTGSVTVTKSWADGADHDSDSVTITITTAAGSNTVDLNKDNSWSANVTYPAFVFDTDGVGTANAITSVTETKINDAALTNGELEIKNDENVVIGKWTSSVAQTDTTYTVTNTYTSVEVPQKYKVSYKYVDTSGNTITDTDVIATKPTDNREFADAASVTPLNPTSTEVTVTGGKWKFEGWDTESKTVNGADVTFTGTWEFTAKQEPGETYDVRLTITKTVDNVHGTAPAEDYKFVVYYKDSEGNPVYLRNASDPLTISLAEDEEFDYSSGTITVKESALNDWPLVNDVRYVYVEEIKGGTEHMSYADKPIRGEFRKSEVSILSAVSKPVYSFYCSEGRYGAFEFTNVYNKLTDRDVTPAKVSPQLNRADHVAYIMGYPDGKVRPEGEITRAEACTIFFRLLTEESRDYYFTKTNDYTDVSRSDWFNNAISTLSNAGIVTGYADGTFRPDQPITRGEMAKIIANFARLGGATKSFTDLSGHWAKSYVELAAGNGWIAGYPDGTFGPDKKITRAETVTMINRVLDRVPAKESRLLPRSVMLTFPDNEPGEWYYIAIQEATNSHTYQRSAYETAGDEMWIKLIDNVDWTKLEK